MPQQKPARTFSEIFDTQ